MPDKSLCDIIKFNEGMLLLNKKDPKLFYWSNKNLLPYVGLGINLDLLRSVIDAPIGEVIKLGASEAVKTLDGGLELRPLTQLKEKDDYTSRFSKNDLAIIIYSINNLCCLKN